MLLKTKAIDRRILDQSGPIIHFQLSICIQMQKNRQNNTLLESQNNKTHIVWPL